MNRDIKFINNIKRKYINKIKDTISLPINAIIYQRLKFNSIVSAEGNPSNAIDIYIEKSFYLYFFSYFTFIFGILFIILSFITTIALIFFGIFLTSISLFELIKPEKMFIFFVNRDFERIENGIYADRYRIIRTMYQSYIMTKDPFFINDSVKINKYVYLFFKFLNYDEGISSEKINKASVYFSKLDTQKFLKDLSMALENQDIKRYYESRESELKLKSESTLKEKITTESTIGTILIFGEGILGLMIGIGTIVQTIMTQVYDSILSNFSGLATSQISSSLSLLQFITNLPPIYYGYLGLLVIAIIIIYMFSIFAKNVGVM